MKSLRILAVLFVFMFSVAVPASESFGQGIRMRAARGAFKAARGAAKAAKVARKAGKAAKIARKSSKIGKATGKLKGRHKVTGVKARYAAAKNSLKLRYNLGKINRIHRANNLNIPKHWTVQHSKQNDGYWYKDPKDGGNSIRLMAGNPSGSLPARKDPYIKYTKNGTFYDKFGKPLANGKTDESHIKLAEYNPEIMPKLW